MNFKSILLTFFCVTMVMSVEAQTTQFKRVTPPTNAKEIVKPAASAKSPTNTAGKQVVLNPENALTPSVTATTYPSALKTTGDVKKQEPATQKYVLRKSKNLKTGEESTKEYMKKEDFDAARKGNYSKTEDAKKY